MGKPMQILKRTMLQIWHKRVPLVLLCILAAGLLCMMNYNNTTYTSSAQMTLNYSEASRGLNPNRTIFSASELTSDTVLQNTIESAGLDGQLTVEKLRSCLSVSPIDVVNVSNAEDYITTTYQIILSLDEKYPHLNADTLMEIYCSSYKDYFMEHYGENQSIFNSKMPDYFESEPYLKLKRLSLRADQIDRYLDARVSENKSYEDTTTGISFLNLYKQIQNVIAYEIPRIQAFILRGGVSTDAESLTSMLLYKIKIEQTKYAVQMAYYDADNVGIRLYDESMSAVVMIPTLDENQQFYMSRTKTALDSMASDADGALTEATAHQDVITATTDVVQQMRTGAVSGENPQVDEMLQSLEDTLNSIQQDLQTTDASYIIYKTQNYLVFNYGAASFSQRIQLKKVILEMAIFAALCVGLCFLKTMEQLKKEQKI